MNRTGRGESPTGDPVEVHNAEWSGWEDLNLRPLPREVHSAPNFNDYCLMYRSGSAVRWTERGSR